MNKYYLEVKFLVGNGECSSTGTSYYPIPCEAREDALKWAWDHLDESQKKEFESCPVKIGHPMEHWVCEKSKCKPIKVGGWHPVRFCRASDGPFVVDRW